MHDPSIVAFDIKSPVSWLLSKFRPRQRWADGSLKQFRYVRPVITIWHEDPMEWGDKQRGRSDDSCGWHTPHLLKADVARWEKHARYEWGHLFAKSKAEAEGASYASVCSDPPDCYTAVYWLWRAIKHEHLKGRWLYRQPWMYGNAPTAGELEAIMNLATNPVDNIGGIMFRDARRPPGASDRHGDDFMAFYWAVHRAYRRYHRPWWRHPRWHIHHWRLQVHVWQQFTRWAFSRCAECGGRFRWGESPVSHSWHGDGPSLRGEKGVYHSECSQVHVQRQRDALDKAAGGGIAPDDARNPATNLFTITPEGHA